LNSRQINPKVEADLDKWSSMDMKHADIHTARCTAMNHHLFLH